MTYWPVGLELLYSAGPTADQQNPWAAISSTEKKLLNVLTAEAKVAFKIIGLL